METIEIPKVIWNPISSLVEHGFYKNEKSAIITIIHDLSLSKMNEYKSAMQEFETKYDTTFENFEQQLNSTEKEDFTKWDDYIEWKVYFKAYSYWNSIHRESPDGYNQNDNNSKKSQCCCRS
jgi:hypothetical protein